MPKRKLMSETKEEKDVKHKGFNLNECAEETEDETDSLMENGIVETTVKLQVPEPEVVVARRVLRSGSDAGDPLKRDKRHRAVKKQGKGSLKEDLIISDDECENFESHEKELKAKPKRGRPRKSDDNDEEILVSDDDKTPGAADFKSQVEVKDENGNVEQYEGDSTLKRKRGRPKKLQMSSEESDEGCSNTNSKLMRTPDLSSQSSVDGLGFRRQRGRPPKSSYGAKVLESGGGSKMVRKRGRPPTPQKKMKSLETDESKSKAKKNLKLTESPSESRNHASPLVDDSRRIGEEENKQNEGGKESISQSKKKLSERILQLLLAAGWTVEYRPRNGRDYKDAVYLNPEGKTHWSVTKAYTSYKNHLESNTSTSGSVLGLLPEEDLILLERNVKKKRCDSGMQREKWDDRKRMHKEKKRTQKKLERSSMSVRKIKREGKYYRKRGALSARNSLEDADSNESGYILFEGKRTILGWMIDSAIMPLNGKVQYMKNTQVVQEGIITREGIQCNCCDEVFSVVDFEVHAGGECNVEPLKSLHLEGVGKSLLQCLAEYWNKESETRIKGFHFVDFSGGDPNDDTCGICGDGGDLICCDGCPSTFHQTCLDIKKFPSGTWFCCYCSCKFCEKVEAADHDIATLPALSRCCLCEEKYHQACSKNDERNTNSFCGKSCQELSEAIELLIGVKHPLPEGFSWTFLRRFELPSDVTNSDIPEKIAYNAKLAVAVSVMDECFSPLVDHRSGVNLLENIVYNFGSNFHRLNYSNFLTVVLERGDEVIGVASIRIHGNQLAEMPFIGTRYMYRRQGMCRRLMNGIESALKSLKVDKLVIPAVPAVMDTWTCGFGFKPVDGSDKKSIDKLNLLVFPGVDMLEKSLVNDSNVSSSNNGCLPVACVEESKPDSSHELKVEEGDDDTKSLEEKQGIDKEVIDLEDNKALSDDENGVKAHQPLGKEIDNKTIVLKKEVTSTSTLRVSPRQIQKSWRTTSQMNSVLIDSAHRCV